MTFINRAKLPVMGGGKGASSKPQVRIGENGQIGLSANCSKLFGTNRKAAVGFDNTARTLTIAVASPALIKKYKLSEDSLFLVKENKKGKTLFFAGTSLLRNLETFENKLYDYRESGNQNFPADVDEATGMISIVLPVGALKKVPTVKRTPRKKKDSPNVPASGDKTGATSDELELEPAS